MLYFAHMQVCMYEHQFYNAFRVNVLEKILRIKPIVNLNALTLSVIRVII